MGQLVNGAWTNENVIKEFDQRGLYVKKPSAFRQAISRDGATGFKAQAGRYHLYAAISCPWAHRAVLFRALKKLQEVIGLTYGASHSEGQGWWFGDAGHIPPGTDRRVHFLHQIYTLSKADYTGKVTVPTIWDSREKVVVNNESSEIIRMFNREFSALAEPTPDFYPAALQGEIEAMNDLVLHGVNDAVNGCGRSTSQEAYDLSFERLFGTLDQLDELLSTRRYLCGDVQTEADWRLFPSLVRFDAIYYVGYKCNRQQLETYPNLSNYLRELYQEPGIAACCDMEENKRLVFGRGGPILTNGIVPGGPRLDFSRPHDRGRFSKGD